MAWAHSTRGTVLVLLLYCEGWAASACEIIEGSRPSVKPGNTTHLEVSWEEVFSKDCIDNQTVTIEVSVQGNVEYTKLFPAGALSKQKAFIKENPCYRYDIRVSVSVSVSKSVQSNNNNYNFEFESQKIFGGFLEQELSKSCPKTPDALKNCVKNQSWSQNDNTMFFSIVHPRNLSEQNLNFNISLKECDAASEEYPFIYIGVSCAAVIVLLVLICTIVMCKSCQTKAATPPKEESDLNDMYGQYEFDDINGGLVRMGSAWGTDTSPSYGHVVDNRRSQAQIMDQNGDYI